MPYIIYAELEFLTKKIDGCAKNQEKSTTTKLGEIFLADIQYQQFWHLIIQKTIITYILGKIL